MTGQSLLDQDELEALENSSKPTKKSDFAQREFKNTKDFVQKFLQEEEFVDIIKEIREDAMLTRVKLFTIMLEFDQYRRTNSISADQFKNSLKNIFKADQNRELTDNENIKINDLSRRIIKVFDTNKNGRLEFTEAVSAFCILTQGSIQSKIKHLMFAYSE
jgi:hypothetical protein